MSGADAIGHADAAEIVSGEEQAAVGRRLAADPVHAVEVAEGVLGHAPGVAGGRFFTYSLDADLSDVAPGEAVLVEFGNRRAVGVVVDEALTPAVTAKPVLARVRSDGPLIDALGLRLLWSAVPGLGWL